MPCASWRGPIWASAPLGILVILTPRRRRQPCWRQYFLLKTFYLSISATHSRADVLRQLALDLHADLEQRLVGPHQQHDGRATGEHVGA